MSTPDHTHDMFQDALTFATTVSSKTNKPFSGKINVEFITKMVQDELEELKEAKDETEKVDALLDAVYYILDHLAKTKLDIRPIWSLIHKANMSKFGEGGYLHESGKWMKPKDFIPPDDEIRKEIQRQRHSL